MAVHIENVSSRVSVTDGSTPLPPETMRRVVAAVIGELEAREAREQRSARDRSLGGGHGSCGCGGGRR